MARKKTVVPISTGIVFIVLCVVVYKAVVQHRCITFLLGRFACILVVMFIVKTYKDRNQLVIFGNLTKYTMPIFVRHTLLASPLQTVLFKVGISM